ncbi:alpha carbonic anhydrase 6-like isoform X4 [Miscanthus floridulus]|uniref:alpha carbonic anhydrase 6-like isoform X4 n=1 Tax=Miscanthus floridulus TaxID=154761 RepID=UPI003458A285
MPRRRNNVALAIVLVIFAFCARYASAVGSTPHSTFSYKEGDPTGPEKWATLQKDWAICDSGTKQSPIDVAKVEVSKDLGPLEQNYKAGAAVVQNRGHDFMLNWTGGNGDLTIEGKKYTLLQVHWHAPSEHTVNGTRFDAEMHMVHEDSTKSKAVVAVLFSTKAGKPSKLLGDVADASKEEITSIDRVKKSSMEPNARPAQKINSRVVRYYKAGATEASAPAPAPGPT